ncbi:unnamed protein product [Caenorhabditis nigoni]
MLSSLLQAKYDRHELNDQFFEELSNLRYGDDSEEKQKYDNIGERFSFWESLSDAQKRRCIVDPWKTIKNKPWNRSNRITISHEDKMEFLSQRWPLDETTCRNLLDRLLNASEADPTRKESIEKPLSDAFADSPLSFDNFHNATRGVPESDLFIRGWFERKHAELLRLRDQQRAQRQASSSDDLPTVYSRIRHASSSNNSMLWAVDMCERIYKIQLAEKAQRALSKKRMIYSQASSNNTSRHIPPVSTMDRCDEIHSPHQSKCVVPKRRGHPLATLVGDVKRRREQLSDGINPINFEAFDKHFEALHRERLGENVSENGPSTISSTSSTGDVLEASQHQTASTRLLAEILSEETVNLDASRVWNQDSLLNASTSTVRQSLLIPIADLPTVPPSSSSSVYTDDIQEFVPADNGGIDTRSGMYSRRAEPSTGTTAQRNSPIRVEESFGGNSTVVEDFGVGNNLAVNISSYPGDFDYQRALRSLPYHSNMLAPTGFGYSQPSTSTQHPIGVPDFYVPQATIEKNHTSTSSQLSSPPPNAISTDDMTHQATFSIAPPPRMMESIMKKLSNEMKNREESGCLDFSQIEVDLRATGKELDDTIAFLNNLTAQLESAKQSGSNQ